MLEVYIKLVKAGKKSIDEVPIEFREAVKIALNL